MQKGPAPAKGRETVVPPSFADIEFTEYPRDTPSRMIGLIYP